MSPVVKPPDEPGQSDFNERIEAQQGQAAEGSQNDPGHKGQENEGKTVRHRLKPALVWVSLGVTAAGTTLALIVLVSGWTTLLNVETLKPTLQTLARAFPAVGGIVVIAAVALLLRAEFTSPDAFAETESSEDDELVIDKFDSMKEHLEAATEAQYRCESDPSMQSIRSHLLAGAVRAVRVEGGLDKQRARAVVRDGRWTDDRVAAGFLAAESQYPPSEWLYGVIDPGGAYRRRVRRTLDAIDTIESTAIAAESGEETGSSSTAGEQLTAEPSPEVEQ